MFTPHAQSAMSQQAHSGRPRLLPGGSLRRHGAAAFHGVACGVFHSHIPSSVAAAIATAARLVALRISRRTAVLAHVWSVSCRFVMTASSVFFAPQGYSTRFKEHDPA